MLVAVAAYVGKTRLIDNVAISFDGGAVRVDLGVAPIASDRRRH